MRAVVPLPPGGGRGRATVPYRIPSTISTSAPFPALASTSPRARRYQVTVHVISPPAGISVYAPCCSTSTYAALL